ncbi:hypothetical protein CRENBAI_017851 [Crenichthys baileyi]|uniref:Uncharacterized protein n=1 Tax=Crenichthys baileyi TaxID=28760 RepID=A0AAV9RX17_9TELE
MAAYMCQGSANYSKERALHGAPPSPTRPIITYPQEATTRPHQPSADGALGPPRDPQITMRKPPEQPPHQGEQSSPYSGSSMAPHPSPPTPNHQGRDAEKEPTNQPTDSYTTMSHSRPQDAWEAIP